MPKYSYTAKAAPQRVLKGIIETESAQEAINRLSKKGYYILSLNSQEVAAERSKLFFRTASPREITTFTRQIATLIESGLNIINALTIVSNQAHNKHLKSVLLDLIARIKDGSAFSESLAAHRDIFSALYIALIRTGEASGNLSISLQRIAQFLEDEEEFKNSLRASLIYPGFVMSVGTLTVIVLLAFVIPRLVSMFETMGQTLPLPTLMLINFSALLRKYWWFILSSAAVLFFFLRRFSKAPQGKAYFDLLKLKMPVAGRIFLKAEVGRLMRALSLLSSSGIPIITALETATSVVGNQVLCRELAIFKEEITRGASLSECFRGSKFFPEFTSSLIAIGEESGRLEKSFLRIADDYEAETQRLLKSLVRLVEPVIILILGLIVGFIVLSMLLPIFQITV